MDAKRCADSLVDKDHMITRYLAGSRKRPQETLELPHQAPHKKQKFKHAKGSLLPPEFWNSLSVIWLTRNALRELDRRNRQAARKAEAQRAEKLTRPLTRHALARWETNNWRPSQPADEALERSSSESLKSVKLLARHGGPNLSDLIGYQEPTSPLTGTMSPSRSGSGSRGRSGFRVQKPGSSSSQSRPSVKPTTKTSTTKNSGPYDLNFQQHLIDDCIFPYGYELSDGSSLAAPDNLEEIKERLSRRRSSLSPSRLPANTFDDFFRANRNAPEESQVMSNVIPLIEGKLKDPRSAAGGVPFRNLEPLTDARLVPGNPDRYYGSRAEDLDRRVRDELEGKIIPTAQHDLPIAPNFFLAVKGMEGSMGVAERQAGYDAALGARGIHSLHNYGKNQDDALYDNKAYAITTIYHGGLLQIFSSHPSNAVERDRIEYVLTPLNQFAMMGNVDVFRQGLTWYRNGLDWAKEQRDEAIKAANKRLKETEAAMLNTSLSATSESSSNGSTEFEDTVRQQPNLSFTTPST